MKLLIVTQKVDRNDPILGFFHRWIEEFAKHCESIIVICLEMGEYHLPSNVRVLSLGKENGRSRLKYILNFYKYIWLERNNYDKVFVHMNQEYVLLGGLIWQFLGKNIFMWRNHKKGNFLTNLAILLTKKVFCTSEFSYTAKFKKTVLMPVGIDTSLFKLEQKILRAPRTVLSLGRISPIKNIDTLIKALGLLKKEGIPFCARIVGNIDRSHLGYGTKLKKMVDDLNLSGEVRFLPGVENTKTTELYSAAFINVNATGSGSFDKTILEAMVSGCLSLSCNENLRGEVDPRQIFSEGDFLDLAEKIKLLCSLSATEIASITNNNINFVSSKHSLVSLAKMLSQQMERL